MINYYMTADDIIESETDTVILPIGSTEQHGAHLPIATDCIIAEAVASEIAENMNIFMLPVLPISTCYEHKGKKGSVWIKPDTFYHMLQDIILSLKEQGFKKIIVLLGHGGIFIAGPAIRELNALYEDLTVIKLDLIQFIGTGEIDKSLECKNNLHAGEYETSLMLFLREELVKKDMISDSIPDVPRDYLNYASLLKYSPSGVWGMPSLGTKEKGEIIFNALVSEGIKYINDVFNVLNE